VVLAVAVIGNDNLQDLKTGQLVDATPWKQQVACWSAWPPVRRWCRRCWNC
jgi:uncharacterized oligopeptide transporter (OPT) family protein